MRGFRHWQRPETRIILARGPITSFKVDAVVRETYNPSLLGKIAATPAEQELFEAVGADKIEQEAQKLPGGDARCPVGSAVIHPFAGGNFKYIIHANGPRGAHTKTFNRNLYSSYMNIFKLANANGIRSLALPPLSYGPKGCEPDETFKVGLAALVDYVDDVEDVLLVVPDAMLRTRYEKLFMQYIDYFGSANCDDHRPVDFSPLTV
eukprot:TRINITY_DN1728_c0_g1::TRINITY_DN1728_c0_g1_i1::g.25217::m.25217 TRINITY_DN1728_c0_g1::TRINITY_DN1728_c0_g1_i1::g.25217  ORF type:complete len:219 (+),score=31.43,sp/B7LT90/YMDB_ESCF3/29.12/4e-11,Macro/PF01661.16/1.9e+03,Macro/PF01661.16/1.7e-13 TRINITY_DN1728_c0_g1_i1:39-659(+)